MALYTGVYLRRDAVSGSVRDKLRLLRSLRAAGAPVEVTVFTQDSDAADACVRVAREVHEVVASEAFAAADLHVFEYGIRYDLCNTVFVIPPGRPILGIYHNVTPPHLGVDAAQRAALEFSLVQRHNLELADHVACDSDFNRRDLVAAGFDAARLSVLHLPPAITPVPRPAAGPEVRLLYVGRFVPSKGIHDLLAAFRRLRASTSQPVTLTLAGSTTFSSPQVIADMERAMATEDCGGTVRLERSPSDAELARLYAASDALIIPSHHEGYCLPVIEAMAAGCYVIASDAGNLPVITGGLGSLVPTGDVDALSAALGALVSAHTRARQGGTPLVLPAGAGEMTAPEWRAAVAAHVDLHSRVRYERRLVELMVGLTPAARVLSAALARRDRARPTPRSDAA